jgi:hypothetical protein
MIQIDHFSKKWSKSIFLRNYVPNRKTFTKMIDLDHCRIWIIDRFGTLSQKWSKSRNDPKPTMIQIRQWSKSIAIVEFRVSARALKTCAAPAMSTSAASRESSGGLSGSSLLLADSHQWPLLRPRAPALLGAGIPPHSCSAVLTCNT